jgi:NADP-dependent 3-hydroxy acid dehydrogenase YdfG
MSGRLVGKSVIVTGASAGIGRACARALAREGADLIVTARREERLAELVREAQAAGTRAAPVVGDAREEKTAIAAVAAAKKLYGRLDILINNAGAGIYKDIVDTSAAEYDHLFDTNVRSDPPFCSRATRCRS